LKSELKMINLSYGPATRYDGDTGIYWENIMKNFVIGAVTAALSFAVITTAIAQEKVVGVSWSNFQEERWKTDEAAIKSALEAAGYGYISADAQSSSGKQLSDIENLMAQGASALIILAQDASSVGPAVQAASDEGIPVIAYDRLIEDPRAFYLTFDNVEVGRMQARAVLAAQPSGNYVMIKGSPTDPNADFLRGGQQEILQSAIDSGKIKIVAEAYTDGWVPANAQRNMEQILTAQDNKVDAVVASNDGTAGGVVAALTAQGMEGLPVSGQDGDHAALNRVATGTQTVSVWKDARELGKAAGQIAVALADGKPVEGAAEWTSPSGTKMNSIFLAPVPITADNLKVVLDAGWIPKEDLCAGSSNAACK
jgi:D-xylose transport system substrate-binding protein